MKLAITKARLAFPAIHQAESVMGGDPRFSAVFIIDPEKQAKLCEDIKGAMSKVAEEKWGAKAAANLKQIMAKGNLFFRDGADKPDYDGFEGMMYASAASKTRPLVIDGNKTPLTEEDGKPYGGCYVNASVEIWAQDNQFGKRINAQLRGVQFVADGEAFGGGGSSASVDEFDELEATDENVDDIFE